MAKLANRSGLVDLRRPGGELVKPEPSAGEVLSQDQFGPGAVLVGRELRGRDTSASTLSVGWSNDSCLDSVGASLARRRGEP